MSEDIERKNFAYVPNGRYCLAKRSYMMGMLFKEQ